MINILVKMKPKKNMTIYTISGLGVDERVFINIKFPCKHIHLDWLEPLKNESLKLYSKRMSKLINTKEPFFLMGVSFGGMIATEISKLLSPAKLILVSSVAYSDELPKLFQTKLAQYLSEFTPKKILHLPPSVGMFLFGTKEKVLLTEILRDIDPVFLKWAIHSITQWIQNEKINNFVTIHGGNDKIIPKPKADLYFEKGGHFIIVDESDNINTFIKQILGF